MKTKLVQRTESLEFITNETFVFCNELKKGFIKRDLSVLNTTDYSFDNISSMIENLSYQNLEDYKLNTVVFVDGEEKYSTKLEKFLNEIQIPILTGKTRDEVIAYYTNLANTRNYFNPSDIQKTLDLLFTDYSGFTASTITEPFSGQLNSIKMSLMESSTNISSFRFRFFDENNNIIDYSSLDYSYTLHAPLTDSTSLRYSVAAGLGGYQDPDPSATSYNPNTYGLLMVDQALDIPNPAELSLEITFNTPLNVSKVEFLSGTEYHTHYVGKFFLQLNDNAESVIVHKETFGYYELVV